MRRRRGRSLFLQILAVLLGVVAASQAASTLLLLVVPLPLPRLTTLDAVAGALRGPASRELLTRTDPGPPADDFVDEQERADALALAARLGVPASDVRVVLSRPSLFPEMTGGPGPRRGGPRRAGPPDEGRNGELLVGSFEAAVRSPAGWRVVRPDMPLVSGWQVRRLLELLAVMLALTPVAWLLARRVSRPVATFAEAAERLGRDPGGAPMVVAGTPEVEEAATAFNEMQHRLRRFVENRTLIVGSMAHDLGTPLARLAFRLEAGPEDLRAAAEGDIAEMKAMIGEALSFVRGTATASIRQTVSLRSLLLTIADDAQDAGGEVRADLLEDVRIEVDVASIRRMLANLVQNAIRYGGSAEILLRQVGRSVEIEIRDPGKGIPTIHLDRVFEPFYRVEGSRNRSTGGTGLGLASALSAARAHGGDIVLRNLDAGGFSATVVLPL